MNNDLNNIEDLFKQSFKNYEGTVNPNSWASIQNAIGNAASATSGISAAKTAASVATKSVLTKVAIGVIAVTTIATTSYFVIDANKKTDAEKITESTVTSNDNPNSSKEQIVVEQVEEQPSEFNNSTSDKEVIEETKIVNNNNIEPIKNEEVSLNENNSIPLTQISNKESANKKDNNQSKESTITTNFNSTEQSFQKTESTPKKWDIRIIASTVKGEAPLEVAFSTSEKAEAYIWEFKDGSENIDEANPYHTFTKPGIYNVTLSVINKNGDSKVLNQIITISSVQKSLLGDIPKIISPNSDRINDIIMINGEHIATFKATVFDDKGKEVFTWNSLEGFWDGRDQSGMLVDEGVYYIIATAKGTDGKEWVKKSAVNVFR